MGRVMLFVNTRLGVTELIPILRSGCVERN
jgi:hypothetical protein